MGRRRFSKFQYLVGFLLVAFLFFRILPLSSTPLTSSTKRKLQFVPSSVNWTEARLFFPPKSVTSYPKGTPKKFPAVQHSFEGISRKQEKINSERRQAVHQTFVRSWEAYKREAWLLDELNPVSGGGKNTFGGWAATLVDALDTLWIFGLYDDFYEAAQAAVRLDWAQTSETSANMFETTIRHLGGLLSAYDLSGEPALLEKAKELGDMLYMGFDTPNRLPGFWINFDDARNGRQVAGTHDPSASPASLSLEFTRLAQLTGESKYYDAIDRYTMMYRKAMDTATEHLLFRPMLPDQKDVLFSGDVHVQPDGQIDHIPESQHLSCFTGGMYLLGGRIFDIDEHLQLGERIARGCGWGYSIFSTGLLPEIFGFVSCPSKQPCYWDADRWLAAQDERRLGIQGLTHAREPKYILRPEAIESVFYLYRVTGQEELRDVAWEMFQSIVDATQTHLAYSAIADVNVKKGETVKTDSMESFWMSETLKYFYLIFSPPDLISLDEYVLNTEAHPLKRPT